MLVDLGSIDQSLCKELERAQIAQLMDQGHGTRIDLHNTLGRVVVATRSFATGDVVMAEQPLVVFDTSGPEGEGVESFLQAFHHAAPSAQASILDMFHPQLDGSTPMVAARRRNAHKLDGVFGLSKECIHKLLVIRDSNCHAYVGHKLGFSEGVNEGLGEARPAKAALFDRGSKVAHSCCPNVTAITNSRHGGLVYFAISPIEAGEMVTFTYLSDLWTTTTRERRAELLECKDFICECTRCDGLDTTCAIRCPVKGCAGFANPAVQQAASAKRLLANDAWVCTVCGPLNAGVMASVLQLERSLQHELDSLEAQAEAVPPNLARSIAERAAKTLSPAHRLVARSYGMVANLCASYASAAQQTGHRHGTSFSAGSEVELRMEAVEAAEKQVKVCECIAAGCCGGIRCAVSHPAVFKCAQASFWCAQDLARVPQRQRSSGALAFVARYVVHMRIMFGEADVADVVKMIGEFTLPCVSAFDALHFHLQGQRHCQLHARSPCEPLPYLTTLRSRRSDRHYEALLPRLWRNARAQTVRQLQGRALLRRRVPARSVA